MKSFLIIMIVALSLSLLFLTGCQSAEKSSKGEMPTQTITSWEMTPAGVYVPVYTTSP